MKKIISFVCIIAIVAATFTVLLQLSISADNKNLIKNGDFSTESLSDWTDENSSRKTTIVKTGTNTIDGATAMVKSKNGAISQVVEVEKNSNYVFCATVKTLGTADANLVVSVLGGKDFDVCLGAVAQLTATSNTKSVELKCNLFTSENTKVKVRICNAFDGTQAAAVDNIKLEKAVFKVNDTLQNGDFETNGMEYWSVEESGFFPDGTNVINGKQSVSSAYGNKGTVSQMFKTVKGYDYGYSLLVKSDSDKKLTVSIFGGSSYTELLASSTFDSTAQAPATLSGKFNCKENTSVKIVISVTSGTHGAIVFDDVIIDLPKVPNDELLNGDFELGNTSGWDCSDDCKLVGNGASGEETWNIFGYSLQLPNKGATASQYIKVKSNTSYFYDITAILCSYNNMDLSFKIYGGNTLTNENLLAEEHETTATFKNRYANFSNSINTGKYTTVTLVFEYNAFDNFACIDNITFDIDNIDSNDKLLNGDFETGDTSGWIWTGDERAVLIEDEENCTCDYAGFPFSILGVFSPKVYADIQGASTNHFYQLINCEPNSVFEYSFYVWSGWADVFVNIYDGKYGQRKLCDTMIINNGSSWGKWYHFSGSVKTGSDAEYIRLDFSARGGIKALYEDSTISGNFFYVDDVIFRERPTSPTKIENSDFEFDHFVEENGYGGWYTETDQISFDSEFGGNSGRYALKFNEQGSIYQVIKVFPDVDYEVSFYDKGTYGKTDIKLLDENNNVIYEDSQIHSNSSEFKKRKGTVRFDREMTVKVFVSADKGTYIDDVVVSEPKDIKPIVSQSTPKILVFNSSLTESESTAVNLIENGDFEAVPEKGMGWNTDEFAGGECISIVNKNGSKALRFSANGETEQEAILWVELKPETEYALSLDLLGDFLSKDNTGNFGIQLINPATSRALSSGNSKAKSITPTCYDGKWHTRTVVFNTGYCTSIGIRFFGTKTTVFADNILLASSDYFYRHKRTADGVTVKEEGFETVTCAESADITSSADWKSGVNYGDVVAYNKGVFYYSSTAAPQFISYIKTLPVKKNTDYVAAFKVRADNDSLSSVGLLSTASNFARFYDRGVSFADNEWESYRVTFNTGNLDEIGFAVTDGGGTMEICDLVICEEGAAVFGEPLSRDTDVYENEDFDDDDLEFEDGEYEEFEDFDGFDDDDDVKKTGKKNKKLTRKYTTVIVTDYNWIFFVIGAAVLVAAGIVIFIIVYKKKKRKGVTKGE